MQFGIFTIGDVTPDPLGGRPASEHDRLQGIARIAEHAEQAGFDVFALGEHHNPPFVSSAPPVLLAFIAARTERLILSTSTTLITTNDPVRMAEEFATLQHLADGRLDLVLGRGNTPAVYPWFGQDIAHSHALASENYALLRRLWREQAIDWRGRFRAPLDGFTSVPRPLNATPPFVWHGSVGSVVTAEQAGSYGDGFLANNLFSPMEAFKHLVEAYRASFTPRGQVPSQTAVVGLGGAAFVRKASQAALREYEPYFRASPLGRGGAVLAEISRTTGLTAGSPAQAIEKVLRSVELFGAYDRQLLGIDFGGVPERIVHEQLDILGSEVLPALRLELDSPYPQPAPLELVQ